MSSGQNGEAKQPHLTDPQRWANLSLGTSGVGHATLAPWGQRPIQ